MEETNRLEEEDEPSPVGAAPPEPDQECPAERQVREADQDLKVPFAPHSLKT